jgi:hypothetical protein
MSTNNPTSSENLECHPDSALITFPIFPKLIPELRTKIWEHAVHDVEARIVEVCLLMHKSMLDDPSDDGWSDYNGLDLTEFTSSEAIPALLHTSHEARTVALRRWKLMFAYQSQPAKIFFDPETDIFFLGPSIVDTHWIFEHLPQEDTRKIKRIGFDLDIQHQYGTFYNGKDLARLLRGNFPVLKELMLAWDANDNDEDQRVIAQLCRTYLKNKWELPLITPIEDEEDDWSDEDEDEEEESDWSELDVRRKMFWRRRR